MMMDVPTHQTAEPTADFFERARARLTLDVPAALRDVNAVAVRGDLDLDETLWQKVGVKPTTPAAVLIPVVARAEPTVLLTLRTPDLRAHSGQIAFPGGRIDPGDETPLAAALREAQEEVGLERRFVDPVGYLDLYLTFSGYRILPMLARVDPDYHMTLNPSEVAEAFEVPLAFLMAPANHRRQSREWRGIQRQFYEMPFGERYIWGVTAGILHNLYERIYSG